MKEQKNIFISVPCMYLRVSCFLKPKISGGIKYDMW
jgi:hypothetical protein